jgi:predicted transcriptional regulator
MGQRLLVGGRNHIRIVIALSVIFVSSLKAQLSIIDSANALKAIYNPLNENRSLYQTIQEQYHEFRTANALALSAKNSFPVQFYDPKNIIPDNPLKREYRTGSYYTPKIVQDKLAHIMQRPPADSFTPILPLLSFGRKAALQYIQIKDDLRLEADDYLEIAADIEILKSLWRKSPQTVLHLYKTKVIQKKYTMKKLISVIQKLQDKRLLKRKRVGKSEILYYPAEPKKTAFETLQKSLDSESTAVEIRGKINNILLKISRKHSYISH